MVQTVKNKLSMTAAKVREFELVVEETIRTRDIDVLKHFTRTVWPEIEKDHTWQKVKPNLYERLQRIYQLYMIVLMPSISQRQMEELFKQGLGAYFNSELMEWYDLWDDLIESNLIGLMHADRDILKTSLRKALVFNEDILTSHDIFRNDKTHPPTIQQWLIDYTSVVGTDFVSTLAMNAYFTKSSNFQKLTDEEKTKVRMLITAYERMKLSSEDPEGLDERVYVVEKDKSYIFDHGRFEVLSSVGKVNFTPDTNYVVLPEEQQSPPAQTALEPAISQPDQALDQEVRQAYQGDKRLEKKITKEFKKLDNQTADDQQLRDSFFKAVQRKKDVEALAMLRVLAKRDGLEKFLSDDAKLHKFLVATWAKRYGEDFAKDFHQNPTKLIYVRLFLQYVLQERLGMAEADAAREGMKLSNIFVKAGKVEYNKMAYYDSESKEFRWFGE